MAEFDLQALLASLRPQLERDEAEGRLAGIRVEDLADAAAHPKAAAAIAELMELEARSVQQGDRAPDFTLPWLPGAAGSETPAFTLSERIGQRPVALVFGSYT